VRNNERWVGEEVLRDRSTVSLQKVAAGVREYKEARATHEGEVPAVRT